jgi:hypothetical protein
MPLAAPMLLECAIEHDQDRHAALAPLTQATNICKPLKADIVSAKLVPGRKLQFKLLAERYDAAQKLSRSISLTVHLAP